MAEVFAGNAMGSHGFQKPVAIKRLLPELANDHVFVDRLIGEAKLLVGMQHGNVVSVLDLCRDGDDVFLVMEFVDGPSLRGLIKSRHPRPLPFGIATYIVQHAAAGLEFAHVRPGGAVIHADVSPSNLLLTTSGEVRVADFGIARREGGGAGIIEGKWAYMAPEQVRGEPLTPRCDVFALGVVLYELVTGQHPFGRKATYGSRESQPLCVVPPRLVCPDIPPGLEAICMKALADEPRERYARMQDMIEALVDERYANGWRESANDLAKIVAEHQPVVQPSQSLQITEPVMTIHTRSLISATPRSARFAEGTKPPMNRAASNDVFSVIARGSAPTVPATQPARDVRAYKWLVAVFASAAIAGAVAALAIRLGAEDRDEVQPPPAPVAEAPAPAPAPVATAAPSEPIVTPLPAPAPVEPAPPPAPVKPTAHAKVRAAAPAPAHVAAPAPAPKHDATLKVVTRDAWAEVTVGGLPSQETPGATFHLAPGKYTVHLKNDDSVRACTVNLDSGHTTTLSVDMSKGNACWAE
jgi:serine/threonine protein kinase